MLVLNPNSVNPFEPVRDEMLMRAKVPMTKEEVRWVSVARLGVQPGGYRLGHRRGHRRGDV